MARKRKWSPAELKEVEDLLYRLDPVEEELIRETGRPETKAMGKVVTDTIDFIRKTFDVKIRSRYGIRTE